MAASDCIGEEVEKLAAALPNGGVLLLENVRFYKEEEKNDPEFAKKLASVADLYVNDAFGTAHRAHASTEGVTKFLRPSVAGFLMQKVVAEMNLISAHYLLEITLKEEKVSFGTYGIAYDLKECKSVHGSFAICSLCNLWAIVQMRT